jgi:GNAT superfamily N-acetyltransferase
MTQDELRPISAAAARQLRSALLRPFESPDELVYFGDDAPDTLHVGAFINGELSGIATVCRDPLPGEEATDVWRLRGMAIKPSLQGLGYGRALLERCISHVSARGGRLLWCNGRVSAAGFYRALGFAVSGEEFEVSGTGPHYLMKRVVASPGT